MAYPAIKRDVIESQGMEERMVKTLLLPYMYLIIHCKAHVLAFGMLHTAGIILPSSSALQSSTDEEWAGTGYQCSQDYQQVLCTSVHA